MHQRSTTTRRAWLATSLVLIVLASVVGLAGTASAGRGPVNDVFSNPTPTTGTTTTVIGSNVGATVQPTEQSPSCCPMNQTVWWTWTATFTGPALIDTAGSTFDTILGLWTGSTLGSLSMIGGNDDGGPGTTSRIEFQAVQGTLYRIQVDGYNANTGAITLHINPVSFPDVGRTYPFWRDVEWIAGEQIADGYEDGLFHPASNISRAAMSAFLFRLAKPAFTPPATPTFNDVGVDHPFYREVEWMNAEEITTGYPGNTYRPGGAVTRGAMSAFIFRFEDATFTPPGAPSFRDVGLSHPFFKEIEWMAGQGITTGYGDDTFRPTGSVTRGAMAAFLARYDHGARPA